MIEKINNFLKSYDQLSGNIKSKKLQNNSFAIAEIKSTINLDISYDCLTSENYVELFQISMSIKELLEKENEIRGFFEKNNNPLKESFYDFYQAYLDVQYDKKVDSNLNKLKFKNFLFNLYEEGN